MTAHHLSTTVRQQIMDAFDFVKRIPGVDPRVIAAATGWINFGTSYSNEDFDVLSMLSGVKERYMKKIAAEGREFADSMDR